MELRDYMEMAIKKAGTARKLAEMIDQKTTAISEIKAQRRGLPHYACVKMAELIGVNSLEVIAASELVTEKDPERQKVWLPFVQAAASRVAAAPSKTHTVSAGGVIGEALDSSLTTARKDALESGGKRRSRKWIAGKGCGVLVLGLGVLLGGLQAGEVKAGEIFKIQTHSLYYVKFSRWASGLWQRIKNTRRWSLSPPFIPSFCE